MYYVYILQSLKDNKFYIGFTTNIEKRIEDHNSGKNLSTELRRPFKLVYYEAHCDKDDALRRESYFKTTKGKATIRQVLRKYLSQQESQGT